MTPGIILMMKIKTFNIKLEIEKERFMHRNLQCKFDQILQFMIVHDMHDPWTHL